MRADHNKNRPLKASQKPVYSKRIDPKTYSLICPHCERRYGIANVMGIIDIVRCSTCPQINHKRYL